MPKPELSAIQLTRPPSVGTHTISTQHHALGDSTALHAAASPSSDTRTRHMIRTTTIGEAARHARKTIAHHKLPLHQAAPPVKAGACSSTPAAVSSSASATPTKLTTMLSRMPHRTWHPHMRGSERPLSRSPFVVTLEPGHRTYISARAVARSTRDTASAMQSRSAH